ncbi:MAG: hypothetical protein PUA75_05070 [Clostridiales bacterium]|nr:hypothetical protein [Clostridiales bacterium]
MMKQEYKTKRKQIILAAVILLEIIILAVSLLGIFRTDRVFKQFNGPEVPTGAETSIVLDSGSYLVTVDYDMETEAVRITPLMETDYGEDDAESILLLKDNSTKTFELLLPANAEGFHFKLPELENPNDFTLKSVKIEETNQADRVTFFCLLCMVLLIDGFFYLWDKKQLFAKQTKEQNGAAVCVGLITIFACVPLFVNYLTSGHDLTFHLMRIEGLAEGLRQGQFPVKMQPLWLNDYGYPVSVMYGDLFLYLPALLRIIGFSLQSAYKIYLASMQLVTAVTSYVCLKEVAGDRKLGVVGCFLYMFATNRMTNIYYRSAVGEYTALAFLPLVFLGLWYLLGKEDAKETDKRKVFFLLVTGYTCILQTHLLTFNIVIIFSLLYCLLSFKKFRKNFVFLVKTAVVTIVLNLCFLVPMADYMLSHNMKVKFASRIENMQEHGLFVSQLFQMFRFPVSLSGNVMNGVGGDMAIGIGLAYMLIIALFCFEILTFFVHRIKGDAAEKISIKESVKIFAMLCLTLLMSCYFFPWNAIGDIPVIGSLLTPYQFAWRFIGIATFLGVVLCMYALNYLQKLTDRTIKVGAIVALCTLTLIGSQYLMDNKLSMDDKFKVTSSASIDTRGAVANGEYLFVESSIMLLSASTPVPENETDINIISYQKKNSKITVECENKSTEERKIQIPFLDYKGYVAENADTGEQISMTCDEQHILSVILPENFEGKVEVYFRQPWYWRVAEIASLLMLLALLVYAGKTSGKNMSGKKYCRKINVYRIQ